MPVKPILKMRLFFLHLCTLVLFLLHLTEILVYEGGKNKHDGPSSHSFRSTVPKCKPNT